MVAVRGAAQLLLCLLAACGTDRITTVDPTVTADAEVWSGGVLALHSPSFTGADTAPIVTVGAETLAVHVVGSDSVRVQVPDTDGTISVGVGLRAGGRALLQVRVHGLARTWQGPEMDNTSIYPWPGSARPTALAFGGGHLVLVDYASRTVSSPLTPDTGLTADCNTSPVPSATVPGLVTAHPSGTGGNCGPVLAVPATATAGPPDTGPVASIYPALHLSRGRWLVSSKNGPFQIATRSDSGFTWGPPVIGSAPVSYAMSPTGHRIVPTWTYANQGGVPVFDATVPGVAYTLTALPRTWTAAFSPGGDTLFVAGDDSAGGEVLLEVNAASGGVLARAPLSGAYYGAGLAVAVDPMRPWVYVAWMAGSQPYVADTPAVDVYDRRSLVRVATLRASTSLFKAVPGDPFNPTWAWAFVPSPLERRLYLTFNNGQGAGLTYVFEYDLMP